MVKPARVLFTVIDTAAYVIHLLDIIYIIHPALSGLVPSTILSLSPGIAAHFGYTALIRVDMMEKPSNVTMSARQPDPG